jgi:multidrug efflux pump subunit AcrA (membrane-fusion protein)
VGLTDRDVVRVRIGDEGTARFDATGDRVYAGVVTEIAAVATPGTGTYADELTLGGPGPLAAGMVGRAEIVPASAERTPVVPVEALLEADGSTAGVFALSADGARAERREITVSYVEGGVVAVTSGLDGVAAVVTDGGAWLSDGEAVRVIR